MSTGTFWANGAVRKCSSTVWKPPRKARKLSGPMAMASEVPIAIGPDRFRQFLAGFNAVDEHFRIAPFAQNVPVLMGLLNIWYVNFLDAHTHAVLPYVQHLHRFPAYLQQLTMESNGKSVRWDGSPVTTQTGEVFWGCLLYTSDAADE